MAPAFSSSFRLILLTLFIVSCFGGIGARLHWLHVVESPRLASIAELHRRDVAPLPARRGNIVDSSGNILATTRTLMELGVDPQLVREEDMKQWPMLARLLDMSVEELEPLFKTRTRPGATEGERRPVQWTKIHDGIDEAVYDSVMKLRIRGVYGNRRFSRFYPGGSLASHTIGYINREGTAVTGVERHLDFYLRGQDGWVESERDGRRREIAHLRSRHIRPTDGLNVELTLDMVIQHMVEEELNRVVSEFHPKGATIIVSDPATGYLLGLGNYPTYDLNRYNREPLEHQRNRAVTDLLEPGSTFKIVPVAGAFNEGLVTPETEFDCSMRVYQSNGRRYDMPRDHRPFGVLSVSDIVAKSSNIGVARLGIQLGPNRLRDYAAAFGFGERTGFTLGGEVRGVLHEVERWDGLTITRLPMGHAVSATPMQIHSAMSAIANDGVLMRPQIVRRVFDRRGETVVEYPPQQRRRAVSPEVARTLSALLVRAASSEGTAVHASIRGYEVAGKTGTTQKIVNGRYSNRHHIATFSGFFPASQPRVAITIIVDEPRTAGNAYGGVVAAPSFRALGDQLIPYMGIPPPDERLEVSGVGLRASGEENWGRRLPDI